MKSKIKVSRSCAEIVGSIDDLLTEILLRLPIKTLIRFKLVSKKWHSLISNLQLCILSNPNPSIGLFVHESDLGVSPTFEYVSFSTNKPTTPPFTKLTFTEDPTGIQILHSCNGLLLCSSFYRENNIGCTYYVFNPTTRRFSRLPELEPGSTDAIYGMSLAFDPSKSPHYKAVCVSGCKSETYKYQLQIYSSDEGGWRKHGEPFTAGLVNLEKGVYWNGGIHWIEDYGGDSLYFNLDDDEKIPHVMPLPPLPEGWVWRNNYYFGESCDHLHYIDSVVATVHLDVYEMPRDYSEWFVKYKVDLSPLIASYPLMNRDYIDQEDWDWYGFSVFSVVRGEKDEEDSFMVIQIPGRVVRYNLVSGCSETIHEYEGAEDEVAQGYLRYLATNVFPHIQYEGCSV